MEHICANCLNAFNSPNEVQVYCANREFDAQFDATILTNVHRTESCGRWSQRKSTQPPLEFNRALQLELFAD